VVTSIGDRRIPCARMSVAGGGTTEAATGWTARWSALASSASPGQYWPSTPVRTRGDVRRLYDGVSFTRIRRSLELACVGRDGCGGSAIVGPFLQLDEPAVRVNWP
jgi:hypothetical protein